MQLPRSNQRHRPCERIPQLAHIQYPIKDFVREIQPRWPVLSPSSSFCLAAMRVLRVTKQVLPMKPADETQPILLFLPSGDASPKVEKPVIPVKTAEPPTAHGVRNIDLYLQTQDSCQVPTAAHMNGQSEQDMLYPKGYLGNPEL